MTILASVFLLCAACRENAPREKPAAGMDSTRMTMIPIADVLMKHSPSLMAIPGVVGTAQGEENGRPCVVVYVKKKDAGIERAIGNRLEGYPVRIEESGDIGPLR